MFSVAFDKQLICYDIRTFDEVVLLRTVSLQLITVRLKKFIFDELIM